VEHTTGARIERVYHRHTHTHTQQAHRLEGVRGEAAEAVADAHDVVAWHAVVYEAVHEAVHLMSCKNKVSIQWYHFELLSQQMPRICIGHWARSQLGAARGHSPDVKCVARANVQEALTSCTRATVC